MHKQYCPDKVKPHLKLTTLAVSLLVVAYLILSNQIVLLSDLPNWYDQQRFLMLVVLATALAAFALKPVAPPFPVGLLLMAALSLSASSPLPGWALAETAMFMGLAVTAYWVSIALRIWDQHRVNGLIYGLIAYGTLISIPPLLQFCVSLMADVADLTLSSLFSGFSNHRFFSQTESVLVPLMALPAMMLDERSRWRRLGIVSACLLWLLAFAAGTRAFYVAMLSGIVFAWFFCGSAGRLWTQWQIRFCAIGWIGYLLLFNALPWILNINISSDNARLNQMDSAINASGRLEMWITAAKLIAEHPLTGIGPMHFATLAQETNFASGLAAHPHNAVIQILVEWGIPVGGAFIYLIIAGFLRFWQRTSEENPGTQSQASEKPVLAITLFTAGCYGLFDGSIVTPYTQVILAFTAGWAWSVFPETPGTTDIRSTANNRLATLFVRITSTLASAFLFWLAITPISQLHNHVQEFAQSHPTTGFYPRFWSQGIIGLPADDRYPNTLFQKSVNPISAE